MWDSQARCVVWIISVTSCCLSSIPRHEFTVLILGLCESFVERDEADESSVDAVEIEGQLFIDVSDTVSDSSVVHDNIAGLAAIFVEESFIVAFDKCATGVEVQSLLRDEQDDLCVAFEACVCGGCSGTEIDMFSHEAATAGVVLDSGGGPQAIFIVVDGEIRMFPIKKISEAGETTEDVV